MNEGRKKWRKRKKTERQRVRSVTRRRQNPNVLYCVQREEIGGDFECNGRFCVVQLLVTLIHPPPTPKDSLSSLPLHGKRLTSGEGKPREGMMYWWHSVFQPPFNPSPPNKHTKLFAQYGKRIVCLDVTVVVQCSLLCLWCMVEKSLFFSPVQWSNLFSFKQLHCFSVTLRLCAFAAISFEINTKWFINK